MKKIVIVVVWLALFGCASVKSVQDVKTAQRTDQKKIQAIVDAHNKLVKFVVGINDGMKKTEALPEIKDSLETPDAAEPVEGVIDVSAAQS